jgi:hypothetical protein
LSRLVPVVLGYGRLPDGLGDMMRQAAWHSMAVIIDLLVSEGVETPPSEYEKFERWNGRVGAGRHPVNPVRPAREGVSGGNQKKWPRRSWKSSSAST